MLSVDVNSDEAGSRSTQGGECSSAFPSEAPVRPQPDPPTANMTDGLVPLSQLEPLMLRVFRTALNERNSASSKKDRRKPGRRKHDHLKLEKAEDTSEIRTTFLVSTWNVTKSVAVMLIAR